MKTIFYSIALLSIFPASAISAPKVISSIVPVHSLVAGVMEGVGEPELLLKGVNSEHQGSYSPRQISDLGRADAVFIIGDNLEVKLGEISGTESVNGKEFVKLDLAPDITTHRIRKGGNWEVDSDEPASGNNADPHIWLDPENAKAMTKAIAETLNQIDPGNSKIYSANAEKQMVALDQLEKDVAQSLAPLRSKPFIVFHDAYQYFEKRFGLNAVGSISDYAATPASAARLQEIHNKVKTTNAACVFKEPQFSDAAIIAVTEGTAAKLGELDPIGAKLTPGKQAYGQLLRGIVKNLTDCLGG
jgi:zinc transport system substrate-binding protein